MIVRQVANVLEMLEYFGKVKKPATLAEISAALEWPRSSTFNLLTTLAQCGYLYEPRPRGGYYPTSRWALLLSNFAASELLPEELCNAAVDVAKATGETTAIAAPAGTNAVLLYIAESPELVRFTAEVGHQLPIHATSCGRALLAQYSPSERASVIKKAELIKLPHRTPMRSKEVEAELASAASRGWHENISGSATDVVGVAVPVGLADRYLSILVAGPTTRMRQRIPQIAAILKRTLKRHLASSAADRI